MKSLVLFIVILALSISSCAPATQPTEPTSTPTYTPSPTATATPTPTITPSPTPDPMQLTADQLGKEGINIDTTTGKLTFEGSEVPNTTFDATGLHIQIGDKTFDFPLADILSRVTVKEGSIVIFDKDKVLYNNPDMSQWPEVVAAFNPNAKTEKWQGWKEKADLIAADKEHPIDAGNTWDEYFDFHDSMKAFLKPFPPDTYRLKMTNPVYEQMGGVHLKTPVFEPFTEWSNPDFVNPFRGGQNFWKVGANKEEGRARDTVGVTEQVYDQVFDAKDAPFIEPQNQTIQVFSFASGVDSRMPAAKFYLYAGHENPDIAYLPLFLFSPNMAGTSRMTPLVAYLKTFGYMNERGVSNGRVQNEVTQFMNTGKIPESLQRAWVDFDEVWYNGLGS